MAVLDEQQLRGYKRLVGEGALGRRFSAIVGPWEAWSEEDGGR